MSVDRAILESWSIVRDYARNRDQLLTLGRAVYRTLQFFGEIAPRDVEPFLIDALLRAGVFKAVCASKRHANPALYPAFAAALARYMLQYEWDNITTSV